MIQTEELAKETNALLHMERMNKDVGMLFCYNNGNNPVGYMNFLFFIFCLSVLPSRIKNCDYMYTLGDNKTWCSL